MKISKATKFNLQPITESLKEDYIFVDNELYDSAKKLNLFKYVKKYAKIKRSGYGLETIIYTLLIWVFLGESSIKMFFEKSLSVFFKGGKDVLYSCMKDEKINWRQISLSTAKEIYVQNNLVFEKESAFVFDDTIKKRTGKKVEGISSHFEHAEGRNVMGHQILELGFVFKDGFIPLDRQIFIGETRTHLLNGEFKNAKSAVAQNFKDAVNMDKNEMFRIMLKRSIRKGINAKYCLADSWFANKKNIKAVKDEGLVGIFRMKRSTLKYLFNGKLYSLTELYYLLRRRFRKCGKSKWKTFSAKVKIDLSEGKNNADWIDIKLVFSAPKNQKKDQWAAFLSMDTSMSNEDVLRIYALRWSIEVYFKEIKQNMGFLKEQSWSYVSHYASIHLAALRYMLLFDILLLSGNGCSFAELRNDLTGKLEMLTFAAMLWELFKAIIYGLLDSFEKLIGTKALEKIKDKIDSTIEIFLKKALQIDEDYIKNEIKAERIGVLI